MDSVTFFILLSVFSAISGLVTEGVKKLAADKVNLPYNLTALITALITGGGGTALYYRLNGIPFTADNIICMALMGLAGGLASMVGFDKIRQAADQLVHRKDQGDSTG